VPLAVSHVIARSYLCLCLRYYVFVFVFEILVFGEFCASHPESVLCWISEPQFMTFDSMNMVYI